MKRDRTTHFLNNEELINLPSEIINSVDDLCYYGGEEQLVSADCLAGWQPWFVRLCNGCSNGFSIDSLLKGKIFEPVFFWKRRRLTSASLNLSLENYSETVIALEVCKQRNTQKASFQSENWAYTNRTTTIIEGHGGGRGKGGKEKGRDGWERQNGGIGDRDRAREWDRRWEGEDKQEREEMKGRRDRDGRTAGGIKR